MIAAWMLYCTALALLLVGAGLALERALHLVGRPSRWVWVGALAGSFVLPALALVKPESFTPIAIPVAAAPTLSSEARATPTTASSRASVVTARFSIADLDRPLSIAWGIASATVLALGGLAALRLRRLKRSWRATLLDGRTVLVSTDIGPAVAGIPAGRIVVPEWALGLDARLQRLMLMHESEHLSARDPWLLVAAALALVAMPWNVALWWQVRRLRLAIEMDCDARVLRRAPDLSTYGELLLSVGRRTSARMPFAPALTEPMSFLERRIRRMTEGRPRRFAARSVALTAAASVALAIACEAPRPVTPEGSAATLGPPSTRGTASVTGAGVSTTGASPVSGGVELARDILRSQYQELFARYAGTQARLWFIADSDGIIVRTGVAAGSSRTVSTQEASHVVPGYDTLAWHSVTLFGPGAIREGSPPVIWLWLGTPKSSARTQATESPAISEAAARSLASISGDSIRMWAAGGDGVSAGRSPGPQYEALSRLANDAIARFHPEYLRTRVDPPVILWILADSMDRVVRHTVTRRYPQIGAAEIKGQFLGMQVFRQGEWISYLAPLGRDREDVRVVWVHSQRPVP